MGMYEFNILAFGGSLVSDFTLFFVLTALLYS